MSVSLPTIVLAEDDEDDVLLARHALAQADITNPLVCVGDGEALLAYLRGTAMTAMLVLLDLNMPRKDGREALAEIKRDERLRRIPVVVLTTSRADDDVARSYDLGVNSFVRKPPRFDDLVEAFRTIGRYWLELVELPCG